MARAVLCGSVNLATREDVFRAVAAVAGTSVTRIPDGETGERLGWTDSQVPRLAAAPQLERIDDEASPYPCFRLRDGADPTALRFAFDYAAVAHESFGAFDALQAEGVIPAGTRFQVSLPTPAAFALYIRPSDAADVLPALERSLLDQLRSIVDAIPHKRLAIQWDLASEMAIIEAFLPDPFAGTSDTLVDAVARLGNAVPEDVELGFHLCYGDEPDADGEGQHFMEPADMSKLVGFANVLSDRIPRPIGWIHMPVPLSRDDDAYFAPLGDLRLPGQAELYLGLVHHEDGVEGAQRRIDMASKYATGFGVATECGMGREPEQNIADLLRIQAQVETPVRNPT